MGYFRGLDTTVIGNLLPAPFRLAVQGIPLHYGAFCCHTRSSDIVQMFSLASLPLTWPYGFSLPIKNMYHMCNEGVSHFDSGYLLDDVVQMCHVGLVFRKILGRPSMLEPIRPFAPSA